MSEQLHGLLVEAFHNGSIDHGGRRFELHSNIPAEECRMLYRQVEAVGAATALEVGMAYGVSSLALADALSSRTDTPMLVSIDPHQHDEWNGVALGQLERAGFADFCQLIEAPSHSALPRLVDLGFGAALALIDGRHTFDHCLVDFFYVDLLLRPGGVVVFDDTWLPGVRSVVEFALRNRAYVLVDSVSMRQNWRASLRHTAGRRGRLVPATAAVALKKAGDDDRRSDEFRSFPTH